MACVFAPPLAAMGGAVRLHIGGVDCDRRIDPSHLDERSEDLLPDPPSRPAIEAIVDRGAGSIDRGAISPSAPALEDMHSASLQTEVTLKLPLRLLEHEFLRAEHIFQHSSAKA